MRQTNMCNFTSSWIQTAQDGKLGMVGLWLQYKNAAFAGFSVFVVQWKKRWCCGVLCTTKTLKPAIVAFLYWRHRPTTPSFPSCAVLYRCIQPKMKLYVFVRLIQGEEKLIGNFFFHFHTRTTWIFDQANKKICHILFKALHYVTYTCCTSKRVSCTQATGHPHGEA